MKSEGAELQRIFVSGFHDDIPLDDVQTLLGSFNASDIHLTNKGFAFATIPEDKVNLCLSLNKSRWKGQHLNVEKAKKPEFSFSKLSSPPESDSESEDDEKISEDVIGKVIGPQKSSTHTLMQWIWNEAEDDAQVRRARKNGWKLLKISKEPKKPGKRRIIFYDDQHLHQRPLEEYYEAVLPYITGEKQSEPKAEHKSVQKLEDIWGSSSDEEDDGFDKSRFDMDSRFELDTRFSEEQADFHRKREEERQHRMEHKAHVNRSKEDTQKVVELDDISEQIKQERSTALDILAAMDLHNPSDTLTEEDRLPEEEGKVVDDNEVLWGKSIPRYDPTMEVEEEPMEENEENENSPAAQLSDTQENETQNEPKGPISKEVRVDTSWARATLGSGTSWSLFGNSDSTENQEIDEDSDSDSNDYMSDIEEENPNIAQVMDDSKDSPATPAVHVRPPSMNFFGFLTEIRERQDESDLFKRQEEMDEIENLWRDSRRNLITDYKRKSKQALQRNTNKK